MLPQQLQQLQQPQGRPMPMSQYQQPQVPQQAPRMPAMAQQPPQGMQPPQDMPPQGWQQGAPQEGRKMPPRGKKALKDKEYLQLLRDNFEAGLDWGENAMMMRSLGAEFPEGSDLDKTFRTLYDLDYNE